MEETYFETIKTWRKEYEEKLGAPDGWLSISGLFWLSEGENHIGAARSCSIELPRWSKPPLAATVTMKGHKITLKATEGVPMIYNGEPLTTLDLKIKDNGSSDWIFLNELKFAVIQRGTRYGVRIYDSKNPARRKYFNIRWFPINESFHIQARFTPYDQPMPLSIMTVLGDLTEELCPGRVDFEISEQSCTIYPIIWEGGKCLRYLFKDATNGALTFPGGRFLDSDLPDEGVVTLDFNKSFNPPCAYITFATCPLPPDINKLNVQVVAGEMNFVG
jgi:uncharacterized protein (DUF1684 family)